MIARIIIPLLLLLLLPQLYIDLHYNRHKKHLRRWRRFWGWAPMLVLAVWAVFLAFEPNFAPGNLSLLFWFLFFLGLIVVPKALFALCSFLGWRWCKRRHKRINWGNLVGFLLAVFAIFVVVYGSTVGPRKLEVRHLDITSADLPAAFDGYRLVHFTDIHVGSYTGSDQQILQNMVDSINAQRADAIMFTGDIQDLEPQELYPVMQMLSSVQAPDGVYSVLGNHDYAYYIPDADEAVKVANERETISRQRQMGWNVLLNEHQAIRRAKDSIVVAGMENLSGAPYPHKGDARAAMQGVKPGAFTIMLEHDPSAWENDILPNSTAQLTLSGHTHGGQFSLFGWSPVSLFHRHGSGLYSQEGRSLYVSKGVGGLIPFRFGVTPEIVVITLHRAQ